MAEARWSAFTTSLKEEKQEIEKKRTIINGRFAEIEMDIKKEERNAKPIPARLKRFRSSLKAELENIRKLNDRDRKEEEERLERYEKEKKNKAIWINEEEQRRLGKAGQDKQLHSEHYNTILWILVGFFVGLAVGFASSALFSQQYRLDSQESSWQWW